MGTQNPKEKEQAKNYNNYVICSYSVEKDQR